jgi:Flp pilus assembly protein TadG
LIEFSLISSVLLMMTLGVVDFGRMFNYGNAAMSAAQAGTAFGALSPANYSDLAGMESAARADASGYSGVNAVASQVCRCQIGGAPVSCPATCSGSGSPQTYIQVEVTIPFNMIAGLPWLPSLTSVRGKSVIRVE